MLSASLDALIDMSSYPYSCQLFACLCTEVLLYPVRIARLFLYLVLSIIL